MISINNEPGAGEEIEAQISTSAKRRWTGCSFTYWIYKQKDK